MPSRSPAETAVADLSPRALRYLPIEELGRGGMGRVLRAYDPRLQREVAIKILAPRGDDRAARDGIRRLVSEARAMAKLSHPNVVEVFDVDDSSGGFALVMEYVPGCSLLAWLEGARPSAPKIVEAFCAAGRGLAAAHAVGLLHRDFKPANVLVDLHGGAVKVADFGLAKARITLADFDSSGGDDRVTREGFVMGTPRYMAPEQHLGRELTPAADQYAFCVALWEALVGAPPFPAGSGYEAKVAGPPLFPATTSGGEPVSRALRDAITRGLHVDPAFRWPSMTALLRALERPAAQRRRVAVGIGAGAFGLLAAAGATLGARDPEPCTGASAQLAEVWGPSERDAVRTAVLGVEAGYATDAWPRLASALDDYARQWVATHTEACEATTVRAERSAADLDRSMACLHRASVGLSAAVEVLRGVDAESLPRAHEVVASLPPLAACNDLERLRMGTEPPAPAELQRVEEARVLLAQSNAEFALGHYEASLAAAEKADARLVGATYPPVRAQVALERGQALRYLARYEQAEAAYDQALQIAVQARLREPAATAATRLMHLIGHIGHRYAAATRYAAIARGMAPDDPVVAATIRSRGAGMLYAQSRFAEAESEYRAALEGFRAELGDHDAVVAAARDDLAMALHNLGRFDEAEAQSRAALAVWRDLLGPDHPDLGISYNNLGNILRDSGRHTEALELHRRAMEVWADALGPDHPNVALGYSNVAVTYYDLGRYEDALEQIRRGMEIFARRSGPDDPTVLGLRNNAAGILQATGQSEEAEREHREILAARIRVLGSDHPSVAQSRTNLAGALLAQAEVEEAAEQMQAAAEIQILTLGVRHPATLRSRAAVAQAWLLLGRAPDALPLIEQVHRESSSAPAEVRGFVAWVFARTLDAVTPGARPPARALELAREAQAAYGETEARFAEVEELDGWLRVHDPMALRR